MTQASYLIGRKKWFRPQGMLWSDSPGTLVLNNPLVPSLGSRYVPTGYETQSEKYVRSIVSSNAQIISLSGSGPWTGTIISAEYIDEINSGYVFIATNGTGSLGTGGTVTVNTIEDANTFTFTKTGGTAPTNGTLTDLNFIVNVGSITGSGPWSATLSNVPNIDNVLVGATITAVDIAPGVLGSNAVVTSVNTTTNSLTYTATTLPVSGTIKSLVISPTTSMLDDTFLILSDHNRAEINISPQRIEQRQRMINGSMRSYHIADKINISTSWNLLPSRSFELDPEFNQTTGKSIYDSLPTDQYTADNGAGGVEMLEWYENHKGPFWVYLSYDKYTNFSSNKRLQLGTYSQIVQMYISSFDYSIVKRGRANYDMWNISVSLEEV
jgi:hypothetical protein